jgi:hypothetical protein
VPKWAGGRTLELARRWAVFSGIGYSDVKIFRFRVFPFVGFIWFKSVALWPVPLRDRKLREAKRKQRSNTIAVTVFISIYPPSRGGGGTLANFFRALFQGLTHPISECLKIRVFFRPAALQRDQAVSLTTPPWLFSVTIS